MKLRCEPGNLAVIVEANYDRNIGKFVTIVGAYPHRAASWWVSSNSVLHGCSRDWPPGTKVGIYDDLLRPIGNQPGQDETLTWLDVPSEVTA